MRIPDLQRLSRDAQRLQFVDNLLKAGLKVYFIYHPIGLRLCGLRPQSKFTYIEISEMNARVYILNTKPNTPEVAQTSCFERYKLIVRYIYV